MKVNEQHAGVIINADEMTINGNQYGTVAPDENARQAARELQSALATAALDRPTRTQAGAQATEIDAAMRAPQPDKSRIAGLLNRLTGLLADAGALATAGAALIGPLHTLATWLGFLGEPILRLLPG
jgi:hypothetical protein